MHNSGCRVQKEMHIIFVWDLYTFCKGNQDSKIKDYSLTPLRRFMKQEFELTDVQGLDFNALSLMI